MRPAVRGAERAVRELLVLCTALGLVPLGPALAATFAELPWQAVALTVVWAACWYVWLWGRLQRAE